MNESQTYIVIRLQEENNNNNILKFKLKKTKKIMWQRRLRDQKLVLRMVDGNIVNEDIWLARLKR